MSDTDLDFAAILGRLARTGPALDVEANLSVTVDGIRLAVSTCDGRLRVQVPSIGACARLARSERTRLPVLASILADAGLTVEVRVGDAVVALVGADANPGRLARRLHLGAVEPRLRGVVAATLRLQ